jgi:hypothetical protein
VRHHLRTGQIPPGSHARRSPQEAWKSLYRFEVFADLLPQRRPRRETNETPENSVDLSDSLGDLQLQTVGVRGLATELAAALESSLQRNKLRIAFTAGFAAGVIVAARVILERWVEYPGTWLFSLVAGFLLLLVASVAGALLAQLTFIELSQLRPARSGEGSLHLGRNVLRLLVCHLVIVGLIAGMLAELASLPGWALAQTEPDWLVEAREGLACTAVVAQVLFQLLLWPLLLCALQLGPIVVVEEYGAGRALGQWLALLGKYLARLFLYEALATGAALLASLPLLLPIGLAALQVPVDGLPGLTGRATLGLLMGPALAPAFAFLTVANVYIYLHLRYDLSPLMWKEQS